jgi:MoaA/NifB/PqqE/SkfB family radical SAM enzyme
LIRELRAARKCGVREYRFSGGDPLVVGDRLFEYADIVSAVTGEKPALLSSGAGITPGWLKKARGKFSEIAVSVENPLAPLQTKLDVENLLEIIRQYTCDETPLTYGLTLVSADRFRDVVDIFTMLYDNVGRKFMPQLDYPCLRTYEPPSPPQLADLRRETASLFERFGLIPCYFAYFVGSLNWAANRQLRINVNLDPDGSYQIYDSFLERLQIEYRWQKYIRAQQQSSSRCGKCEWVDCCTHHPRWELRYDWCELRRAVFEGMYDGLWGRKGQLKAP